MEKNSNIESYLASLTQEKAEPISLLRKLIKDNLPLGFTEVSSYGAIGYVVPHQLYPAGYHCNPDLPLPFINLVAQKNFVALYHMGLYADKELLEWFVTEYPKNSKYKLDMGKSCIRFKTTEYIPQQLIASLCKKITPQDWITAYENQVKKKS